MAKEFLQNLGLTEYQSKLMAALAELKEATAKELARRARIPQNKTYENLETLEKDGFITSLPLRPKRYSLQGVEALRRKIDERRQAVEQLPEQLAVFEKILAHPSRAESKERFWIIKGQRNIIRKLNEETENLQKESFAVVRYLQSRPESIRSVTKATSRGVKVKILCVKDAQVVKNLPQWRDSGAEIRLYDEASFGPLGTRFNVLDKQKVRITIGKPEVATPEEYITLWCESESFAAMMRSHFLHLWKKASPS